MVKHVFYLSFLLISFSSVADIQLDRSQIYTVPKGENWSITNIDKADCNICTTDIFVKSGQVRINGIWVAGKFKFILPKKYEIIFHSGATFGLGDVMRKITVKKLILNK
ncbi:hypothetical protein [Vibrio spartinae]|uniref:Uncharacterized protein n=1 Tax=Vibrio spartinae TaxID=1918945 RepID=A0A1N6LZB3_9VIBR|nr:hypothetical protein [Vibrio spartinae]SIO92525.1 hypothetical protein VSP9026_00138 [Vibrio spartinae]